MLLYHYTHITTAIDKINQDAVLKVQKTDQDNGLKPALWFSENNKYETSEYEKIPCASFWAGLALSVKGE